MSQQLFLGPEVVALLGRKVCCGQNHGPIMDVHDTNCGWSGNSLSLFCALLTSLLGPRVLGPEAIVMALLPFILAFVVL